jgi:transcription antitermination factor NusG
MQMPSASSVNWFAVYVGARQEKSVGEQFRLRQIEAFLPLYKTVHRWKNGCKMNLELPLFPNYLFVRVDPRERLRVVRVPGVLSMVCCGREPVPVPQAVIESLRSAIALGQIEPHPYLVVGQRVRIKSGVLAGMEGVLVRKKENLRVVLSLDQIMQSAAVEVEGSEVEHLGETRALPAAS